MSELLTASWDMRTLARKRAGFSPTDYTNKQTVRANLTVCLLAQREGFEPSCGVIHKLISSPFGNLEVVEQYYPKLAIFQ